MQRAIRSLALPLALVVTLALTPGANALGPSVVPTAEGQLGTTPAPGDQVFGARFESLRGAMADVVFGGITGFGGVLPPPPEAQFLTDRIHGTPSPMPLGQVTATFDSVDKLAPSTSAVPIGNDDFVAFSFAVDGAAPQTMNILVGTYNTSDGMFDSQTAASGLLVPVPDPSLSQTGVAIDNQGRVTVVYTDLPPAAPAVVKAKRYDADGNPIGGELTVTDGGHAATDIALLDPAGNRLIVPTSDFASIRGNLVDTTGPAPAVLPEFPISTTPALFANLNTQVASDPQSGIAYVAWENLSALQGDPVNVFARRFDADGNPVGNDFRVNTTTADAQGQPAVAVGPNGVAVVAWAGDSPIPGAGLDVFAQVYAPDGSPIGGEIPVNTFTDDTQDRPAVRFLPEPDAQGRPQFTVLWRDVGMPDGTQARGTGRSYRCFSIEGLEDPTAIFADGFESGDTTSWSDSQP